MQGAKIYVDDKINVRRRRNAVKNEKGLQDEK